MRFLKFAVLLHCHEMKFTMINIHFISETVLHSYMDPQAILMLCDRMILLFLEGGIEDKMELKSKKIFFFTHTPTLTAFHNRNEFLKQCIWGNTPRQRFVIHFYVPNLWLKCAGWNLIGFDSQQKEGPWCAPWTEWRTTVE